MRKIAPSVVCVALALLLSMGILSSMTGNVEALTAKPNMVFILTDDMRKDDLRYMPKTRSVLQEKGMTFQNAFVSNALCCPARATIMRGQYAHNTRVWTNVNVGGPDAGGQAYRNKGHEQDNVATRLDAAGYRTTLNGMKDETRVPPGWDRWFAIWGGYFRYDANDQGTVRHFGADERDYQTDVLRRETNDFIGASVAASKPFFAYVALKAPHGPATPAPRDQHE